MRKKLFIGLSITMMLSLSSCGQNRITQSPEATTEPTEKRPTETYEETITYDITDVSISVPQSWAYTNSDNNHYFYPEESISTGDVPAMFMVSYMDMDIPNNLSDSQAKQYFESINDGMTQGGAIVSEYQILEGYSNYPGEYVLSTQTINDTLYNTESYIIFYNSDAYVFSMSIADGHKKTYSDELEDIVLQIQYKADDTENYNFDDTEDNNDTIEATTELDLEEMQTTDTELTTGQSNALSMALSYLDSMPFSHDGLIDQLKYEGFSDDEATYAADNCGADWDEQALRHALSYLDSSAFSYEGLIDQLEYEGYTTDQAEYGADNCDADWNEQVEKMAENYMDSFSFSRSELIDQLEYEGFTSEQAEHGADFVGY